MIQYGISELSKNPSLIERSVEAIQIVNKKTKEPKGIFIPKSVTPLYEKILKEIEYREFLARNANLQTLEEDETLEDGLDDQQG